MGEREKAVRKAIAALQHLLVVADEGVGPRGLWEDDVRRIKALIGALETYTRVTR